METRALWAAGLSTALAACTLSPPQGTPTERPVDAAPAAPAARVYRPGIGVVESVSVVSLPSLSAAGGATGPTMAYRLRMADGTLQDVVQTGERFELGDRVRVTQEGRLARP
jgi:hypothetical protein